MLATLNGSRISRFFDQIDPWLNNLDTAKNSWLTNGFNIDIEETPEAYVLTADLPGMKREDIDISVQDNQVSIFCERKEENKRYIFAERKYGKFSRSVKLPDTTGEITANLKDGILTLTIEKSEKVKPKKIEVK